MNAIERCRTAALGGHVEQCDACGHQRISFNSCRDRHCPKCQCLTRAQWLDDRRAEVLPVEYFHVVFTLPKEIAAIAYQNKALVYDMLFRVTAQTLRTVAADPKRLGAEIGFIAILHTWGQNLLHHPHLHCVVPGGGLSADGKRWIGCRPGFFLPVRVLSRLFRSLFLAELRQAYDSAALCFFNDLAPLLQPQDFARYLAPVARGEWIVYAKPPFGGPDRVLEYLGRYTHRVAISNNRLVGFSGEEVAFRWKDYRHDSKQKVMRLTADEFVRRFLHACSASRRSQPARDHAVHRRMPHENLSPLLATCPRRPPSPGADQVRTGRGILTKTGHAAALGHWHPTSDPGLATTLCTCAKDRVAHTSTRLTTPSIQYP